MIHGIGKRLFISGLVFIILGVMVVTVKAGEISFDGEIRERFETLDGMNKKTYGDHSIDAKGNVKGGPDDRLLLQRIIAGFTYRQNEHITYHLHMYDARVRGWSLDEDNFIKNKGTPDEYTMDPDEEYFELHDANIEINDLFINGLSTQLGRQKIWYGDKRIFGPGGWGNSIGWLWDAVHFSYKKNGNFIDAWYGQTKTKDPCSFSLLEKHAYQGIGFYSHFRTIKHGAIEPFFAWKNNLFHSVTPEEKTYYFGARFYEKDYNNLNWDITYAGERGDIGNKTVRAYGYIAKVGYLFRNIPMRPNIVLGRVFASGDSNTTDNTIRTFTTPFGSTDGEHYGRMDIMSWSNLVDNQINLYVDPTEKNHIKLSCHNFFLDEPEDTWSYYKYRNLPGNSYTHLGKEFDFQYRYDYSRALSFQVSYAYFDAGDFVTNNVEDNDTHRLFLQCTYRFHFPLSK